MKENLIIDGNAVYEIDMDCMKKMERKREREKLSNSVKANHLRKGYDSKEKKY